MSPSEPSTEQESASLAKTSVCRGELNFVNVQGAGSDALAPNQTSHVWLPGQSAPLQGTQVPFRLNAAGDEVIRVAIETDGVISRELTLPLPVVEDCEHPPGLQVSIHPELGSLDRPAFIVSVVGAGEAERRIDLKHLKWDFGDGQTAETAGPTVQHSYESRLQSTRYSHYLVHVAAQDAAGRNLEGAMSLVLSNPAFRHLDRDGSVRLMVSVDEDTTTDPPTHNFRLYHGYDADVSIESISMVETAYAGSGARPVRAEPVDISPSKVLGSPRIAAGETRQLTHLHELAANRPGVIRRLYLKGTTDDGRPASGRISLAPNKQSLN